MNLEQAIKDISIPTGCIIPTDEYGYLNFNVDFINNDKQIDQTQFDVYPYRFDFVQKKCKELQELWKEFCEENGFKQNSITGISIANL